MKTKTNLSRRALSVLLVLVMCLGMFQMPAFAADETDVSNAAQESGPAQSVPDTPKTTEASTETKPGTPAEKQEPTEVTTPDKDSEPEKSDESNNVGTKPEDKGGETETTVPEKAPETGKPTETVTNTPKYATVQQLNAAFEKVGETDDVDTALAALNNYLAIYNRLSPEDKAANAEALAAANAYRETLVAAKESEENSDQNLDPDIQTLDNITGEKFTVNVVKVVNGSVAATKQVTSTCTYTTGHSGFNHQTNLRTLVSLSGFSGYKGYAWSKYTTVPSSYTTGLVPNSPYTGVHYNIQGSTPYKGDETLFLFYETAPHTIYINCYDENNNLIHSTQQNNKYEGNDYSVYAPDVSGYTKTGTTHYSGTMPNNDVTLNFYYKSNVQQVTLTYMDRGTKYGDVESYNKNTDVTVKSCTNTRNSYVFKGWDTNSAAKTVVYKAGATFTITANTTLYAVWEKANPAISVTKTVNGKTEVKPGDTVTFNITVTNSGNVDFRMVVVSDTLPDGLTYVSATGDPINPGIWVLADVKAGISNSFTITATVDDNATGTLTNSVSATGQTSDYKQYEKTDTASVTVDNGNGISITKTRVSINGESDKTTAEPGDEIKWTITVTNNSNVTKTVTLTEQMAGAYVYFTDTNTNVQTVTLAAGETKTVTATYTVRGTDKGKTIVNTVAATTGGTGDKENPTATDGGTTVPGDEPYVNDTTPTGTFTVDKAWAGDLPEADRPNVTFDYEVTYKDKDGKVQAYKETGTVAAGGIITAHVWKDPDNWSDTAKQHAYKIYVKLTEKNADVVGYTRVFGAQYPGEASDFSGDTCTKSFAGNHVSGTISVKNTYTKNPVEKVTVTWKDGYTETSIKEEAIDKGGDYSKLYPDDPTREGYVFDGWDDPVTDDKDNITITAKWAQFTVTKTADKTSYTAGDTVTWTITVSHNGDSTITGLKLTDTLSGVTLTAKNPSTNDPINFSLAKGETATFTATLTGADEGSYTNVAELTKGENPLGKGTSSTVTVKDSDPGPGPDDPKDNGAGITITKTRTSSDTAKAGDTITWNIVVKNSSNVTKTVTLTEQDGVTLSESTFALAAGAEKTVTATYTVTGNETLTDGKFFNTVKGSTGGTGENENPEAKDDGTEIDKSDDTVEPDWSKLTIKKAASVEKAKAGDEITYTITVTNNTGKDLKDIKVKEVLPVQVTLKDTAPTGYSDGVWTISALKNGETETLVLTVMVNAGVADTTITNTATVTDASTTDTPSETLPDDNKPESKVDVTVPDDTGDSGRTHTVTWIDGLTGNQIGTPVTVNEGGTNPAADTRTPPSHTGYRFTGWTTNTDANGNITYTANYTSIGGGDPTPVTYTVTYDLNGGSSGAQLVYPNLTAGTITPRIADPSREGYVFAGWTPTVASTVTGNITYVAQWTEITDIPDDPNVPGGDQPDEPDNPDDPGVDIPDEPVPGGDQPDLPDEPDDPGIDIPDEPTPGGDRPVIPTRPVTPTTPGLTDIPDEEVPLADTPETGDNVWVWYLTALLSAAGIAVLAVLENKKRAKR